MDEIKISYLRHGVVLTGGARHEDFMFEALQKELDAKGIKYQAEKKVASRLFNGWQNLKLMFWAFRNSDAGINIVVGRLGISSILRNCFSKRKTLIVFHNFDKRDGKNKLLALYYKLLFYLLSKANPAKVALITVSPYFQTYFRRLFPNLQVLFFPNLFDTHKYLALRSARKPKAIVLGQVSSKYDASVYTLAASLTEKGYAPFFCTLRQGEQGHFTDFEVKKLEFEDYLKSVAAANCSISFSGVNEGWPRMVHESILLGTPVIGYEKGGLGSLLRESNSYIVKNPDEAMALLESAPLLPYRTPDSFIQAYDISRASHYLAPILKFMLLK